MVCGLLSQLAMTAVLLGSPELKIESRKDSPRKFCFTAEPSNSNAVVNLKDAHGKTLLTRKIHVSDLKYYDTEEKRGGVPAKNISFIFTYPRTKVTSKAETVELEINDRKYVQSVVLAGKK